MMHWHRQLLAPRHVRPLAASLAPLFAPRVLGAVVALCLWIHATTLPMAIGQVGYRELLTYTPLELLLVVLMSTLRCLLHEIGHAAACLRLAGSVGGIGFGLFVMTPVLYCDVSDVHLLSRKSKATIGIAGAVVDLVFLATWALLAGDTVLASKVYLIGMFSALLNLMPFYRSDGYWVLSDLAGRRDMLEHSLRAMRAGTMRPMDAAVLGFTACCVLAAAGLATGFALRWGPQQMAEAALHWPEFPAAVLVAITTLQYAAVVFGMLGVVRLVQRIVSPRGLMLSHRP